MVFFRNRFDVIFSLHIHFKLTELLGNFRVKAGLAVRVVQIIGLLHDTDFKQETVFRIINPILEFLFAEVLDKLVRILVGTHVDNLTGKPRLLQNTDTAESCLYTGAVTVVSQKHLVRVAF